MDPTSNPPTAGQASLSDVLSDVLGDLAFMVADDQAAELPAGAVWLRSEISFHGPHNGALRLWCTRDFATRLAANLLGLEPEEGGAQVGADDAVREFMNVLCGQVVTAWFGSGPVFNLSIPDVQECIEAPQGPDADSTEWCVLAIDGEPLICGAVRGG